MPSSMLFAVNNEGRVFGLSTNGTKWREFPYLGLDFKTVSAIPHFLWAVGSDRQIYVHVHGLDIPIRIKEESYENQRWTPFGGFSNSLLPTDRWQFSSEDGLTDRSLEKIRVPSMAWQWEGEWKIETVMNGEPLDHDGWTYAIDFPRTYYSTQQWNSCVRRRKWVRTRRYAAMNSWCAVAPLHKDPTREPFIDISVGGQLMASRQGELQVWAVTAHGRVMWRKDVSLTSPEGTRWNVVNLPSGSEVRRISCGTTGLVWAVLWSGKALVRTQISSVSPMGEEWVEVDSPENDIKLIQVCIGHDSVWAVTNDKRVWFRKGVKGESTGSTELATGTGWVEMVGTMGMVSVAPNDQVLAVGTDDRSLYFRVGVNPAELTGKRWRCINAAVQMSRASSVASSCSFLSQRSHRSTLSLCQLSMSEIVCISSYSEPGAPRIAIHTRNSSRKGSTPLRLQFNSDNDHDEWMAYLSYIHAGIADLEGPPSDTSIWAISNLGDVYVFDHSLIKVVVPLEEMTWKQVGGHLKKIETCSAGVTWGISSENIPYIYTGGWGGQFLNCLQKSPAGIHGMEDYCTLDVWENQRWNPLNGFSSRGLPTDRPMWSDSTGFHKRSKETTKLLNKHWQWVTDWSVDFRAPGGVDVDGWQYAVDFSTSYHPQKKSDRLRTKATVDSDRKTYDIRPLDWCRAFKSHRYFPSGELWELIEPPKNALIKKVSVGRWAVWALDDKGKIYVRREVTPVFPEGTHWQLISTDDSDTFKDISASGDEVWAITMQRALVRRLGVSCENPAGFSWIRAVSANWTYVSARSYTSKTMPQKR
ncbi:unnamed protein product [Nesidiocoris tenuis]|uniref:Peroxin/Ferlin domain-containing protein n=1 Tax=Nesidiocoris tenuis TaxID=355587 RepID=A0A6H5FWP5_9HEMI|nr:unnamed protein product [Nesidiocoris tenuis]